VTEKDNAQATLDTVTPKFDLAAATRLACRTEQDEARAVLGPAQEDYALARRHTVEQIVHALTQKGAWNWVHITNTSMLELWTLALRFMKDCLSRSECSSRSSPSDDSHHCHRQPPRRSNHQKIGYA
jgi:hypothetical protein